MPGALHKQRVPGILSMLRLPCLAVPAVNQLSLARTSAVCAHHQAVSKAADATWLQAVNHLCFSSALWKYFGSWKQRNLGNNGSEEGIDHASPPNDVGVGGWTEGRLGICFISTGFKTVILVLGADPDESCIPPPKKGVGTRNKKQ